MRGWVLLGSVLLYGAVADYIELKECHGLKIHCLDISTLARYGEFEECDLDKVRVRPRPVSYRFELELLLCACYQA